MLNLLKTKYLALGASALAMAALSGCGGGGGGGNSSASAGNIVGLTSNNQLVRFSSSNPSNSTTPLTITGLQAGDVLVGIDRRPADGNVYGIGSANRVYRINTQTGAATVIGAAGAFALSGADFGVDFNPTVDRIRVVSNADQNLRINPNDGTLSGTDTTLSYAAGDVNFGVNPNQVAVSYTNSFDGAPSTALFGIDTNRDVLTTQNPANAGTLTTIGALGIDFTGKVAFDIAPPAPASSTPDVAFAAFNGGGGPQLYTINLTTGAATLVGNIGSLVPIISMTVVS